MNLRQSDVVTNQNMRDSGIAQGVVGKNRSQETKSELDQRNNIGSNKIFKEFRQED